MWQAARSNSNHVLMKAIVYGIEVFIRLYQVWWFMEIHFLLNLNQLKVSKFSRQEGGDELRIWARKRFYQQPAVARWVPDISHKPCRWCISKFINQELGAFTVDTDSSSFWADHPWPEPGRPPTPQPLKAGSGRLQPAAGWIPTPGVPVDEGEEKHQEEPGCCFFCFCDKDWLLTALLLPPRQDMMINNLHVKGSSLSEDSPSARSCIQGPVQRGRPSKPVVQDFDLSMLNLIK